MSFHFDGLCRVAIAGASSLRGKELKQVLEERNFPATDFILLDDALSAGTLTEAGGEPTFIRPLDEDSFEGSRFAFFAGSPEEAARNWATARRAGATLIDLSGGLAKVARTVPWIPSLTKLLPSPAASAINNDSKPIYSSPATPVLIACTLAGALRDFSPARLAIVFFPPVSERGQAGVDELESQTTNLLSFRPISQPVFDAQVAFNLLSGYGEASRPEFGEVRAGMASEISRYLAGRAPLPAIQMVQAPVFYGYAFAAFAEFAAPDLAGIESALTGAGARIAASDAPPTNVSVAGENEIHLARPEKDPNVNGGVWLWGVADNLRVAATNAVRIAEGLLAVPA